MSLPRGRFTYLSLLATSGICLPGLHASNIYVSSEQPNGPVYGYSGAGNPLFSDLVQGQPIGLGLDAASNLYAAVYAPGAAQNSIVKFSGSTASSGTPFAILSGVSGPFGVAFDASGNLYVSALSSNVIQKFDANGTLLVADLANITNPRGIAIDSTGNLWVVSSANGGAIYKITNTVTPNQNPAPILTAGLSDPRYDVFDSSGNLYVSNTGVGGSTGFIEKYAAGSLSASTFATNLGGPNGLGFDTAGNLFVADYFDNNVREFAANGANLGIFASSVTTANGLAVSGVPEPSTWFLIGLGLGFGSLIRRWIA